MLPFALFNILAFGGSEGLVDIEVRLRITDKWLKNRLKERYEFCQNKKNKNKGELGGSIPRSVLWPCSISVSNLTFFISLVLTSHV